MTTGAANASIVEIGSGNMLLDADSDVEEFDVEAKLHGVLADYSTRKRRWRELAKSLDTERKKCAKLEEELREIKTNGARLEQLNDLSLVTNFIALDANLIKVSRVPWVVSSPCFDQIADFADLRMGTL